MTNTPVAELHDSLAKERADWLLDAIACATQDRRFLRGEPEYDEVAGEAILLNGEKAIKAALEEALRDRTTAAEADADRLAEALTHMVAQFQHPDQLADQALAAHTQRMNAKENTQ